MILKNFKNRLNAERLMQNAVSNRLLSAFSILLFAFTSGLHIIQAKRFWLAACSLWLVALSSCYSFKDRGAIPADIKTVRINYIENRARIVNPQLSQRLTEKLRQKVINQTRLSQTNNDDADYDISGQITDYYVTTSGISNQQAASNNLNVTVHLVFKNRKDDRKNFEADLTRNFPFSANLSLAQTENSLTDLVVQNMTDEIFNRIFSNW